MTFQAPIFSSSPFMAHAAFSVCWSKEHLCSSPRLVIRVPSLKMKDDRCKVKIKVDESRFLTHCSCCQRQNVFYSKWAASESKSYWICLPKHSIGCSISKARVCLNSSSTTADCEMWLTTVIKYSISMRWKRLLYSKQFSEQFLLWSSWKCVLSHAQWSVTRTLILLTVSV